MNDPIPEELEKWYKGLNSLEREAFQIEVAETIHTKKIWSPEYRSSKTGKIYEPHNEEERFFVYSDTPRYMLLKGGEGAGKSVAGVIKDFERLRRGMDVIAISPDLPHFKKSLWPIILEWCPWEMVIERNRSLMTEAGWQPSTTFEIWFYNEQGRFSKMTCGGIRESDVMSFEGPNVSACHFDEGRRHNKAGALKVLDGRARIVGPKGEPPQIYITTTPRKNYLFTYFGPLEKEDPFESFKKDSFVATVITEENAANLSPTFHVDRAKSLNSTEQRIHLLAEWEDEADVEKFVNIAWWDACKGEIPKMPKHWPMVLGLDASKGGDTSLPDSFAVVGVSRHPQDKNIVVIRYAQIWKPPAGGLLDYEPAKLEIKRLNKANPVVENAYDPYQLHDTCTTLRKEGIGVFKEFGGKAVLYADRRLQAKIVDRTILHDGDPTLRFHIDNADCKKQEDDKIRIVKRAPSLKVDLAKATAIAVERCMYYNL